MYLYIEYYSVTYCKDDARAYVQLFNVQVVMIAKNVDNFHDKQNKCRNCAFVPSNKYGNSKQKQKIFATSAQTATTTAMNRQ